MTHTHTHTHTYTHTHTHMLTPPFHRPHAPTPPGTLSTSPTLQALFPSMCVCVRVSIGLTEHTERELARVVLKSLGRTRQGQIGRHACVCVFVCVCVCVCVHRFSMSLRHPTVLLHPPHVAVHRVVYHASCQARGPKTHTEATLAAPGPPSHTHRPLGRPVHTGTRRMVCCRVFCRAERTRGLGGRCREDKGDMRMGHHRLESCRVAR